ncbi:MAG: hypothetical protein ACHQU0_03615 [Candidatus Paceibacteria bacterium]
MRGRNSKGTFVKVPASTAERMEQLGVTVAEMYVLKLVVSHDFHPDFAVKAVKRYCGIEVDVKALHAKLLAESHDLLPPIPR